MATPRKRWYEEEDEGLVPSAFQKPRPQPRQPTAQPFMRPGTEGTQGFTDSPPIARPTRPAGGTQPPMQRTGTAAPPRGNLDFSTLVGSPANAAPPSTTAQPSARMTRVDHRTYQPPGGQSAEDFFRHTQPGAPVAEQPGMVWQHDGTGWMWMPAGATPPGNPTQPQGDPRFSWMQSESYEPGEIGMDDMPDYSAEDLLQRMGPDYVPTRVSGGDYRSTDVTPEDFDTYDFEGFAGLPDYDVGTIDDETEALISRLLANPESLDQRTIDMMKAASREEQSALAAQADDEMRAMGFDLGIEASPWLAAERLQNRRDRDAAVIAGNRGIDIDAAKTNAGDRRAAATLGATYVDSKGRLKLAQRGQVFSEQAEGERNKQTATASKQARAQYLTGVQTGNADRALESAKVRMQADIANNDNVFKAASLRKDKVLGTVDADLRRAAATTDRLQLREQVKQAAADLGLQRDKVMSDWLQALLDDATQRYGIDQSVLVDREKLAQAGSEFKEDLAFRIMAHDKEMGYKYASLGESGRQFDYGLGLSYSNLFENARQHDDDIYARSQGF